MAFDFTRVDADIAAGRLWKARDRLQGMRSHAPADQEVLDRLGRVRFEMGDLPAAGLAWFLTPGAGGADREVAVAVMQERYGRDSEELARQLSLGGPLADYPPEVQERLRGLVEPYGMRWPDELGVPVVEPQHWVGQTLGCVVAIVLFVIPWIAGLMVLLGRIG